MKERKSFLIRIDPSLHAELERWAAAELRSVNGQIEYLLKEAVRHRTGRATASVEESSASEAGPKPPSH